MKRLLLILLSLMLVTGCSKQNDNPRELIEPADISIEEILFNNYWHEATGDSIVYKNFNKQSVMTIDIESMEGYDGEVVEDMKVTDDTVTLDVVKYLYDYSTIESKYYIKLINENTIEVTYNFKNGEFIETYTYECVSFDEIRSTLEDYSDYFYSLDDCLSFFNQETITISEPETSTQVVNITKDEASSILLDFYAENDVVTSEGTFDLIDYTYNGRNGYLVTENDTTPFIFLGAMGTVFIDYETGEIIEIEPINANTERGY